MLRERPRQSSAPLAVLPPRAAWGLPLARSVRRACRFRRSAVEAAAPPEPVAAAAGALHRAPGREPLTRVRRRGGTVRVLQVPGPGERSDRANLQIRSTVVAPSGTFIGQEMLPEREQALERKGRFVCSMHALMCGVSRRGSLLCTRPSGRAANSTPARPRAGSRSRSGRGRAGRPARRSSASVACLGREGHEAGPSSGRFRHRHAPACGSAQVGAPGLLCDREICYTCKLCPARAPSQHLGRGQKPRPCHPAVGSALPRASTRIATDSPPPSR